MTTTDTIAPTTDDQRTKFTAYKVLFEWRPETVDPHVSAIISDLPINTPIWQNHANQETDLTLDEALAHQSAEMLKKLPRVGDIKVVTCEFESDGSMAAIFERISNGEPLETIIEDMKMRRVKGHSHD